jgi:ABC-2 type transport system permease protein
MTDAQVFTLLPAFSLARRELVRFYRQRARIIGSLGTPIVLWALLGSGLQAAFPSSPGGTNPVSYLKYFFPGNLVLTILFTSIFTNISVIEDRNEGFLQGVLVAPVTRLGLVFGKVWGGAVIALIQGILFLSLAPLAGFSLSFLALIQILLAILVTSLCLTTIGFIFAWKLDSIQGFHSVMNLFLMPMWLLSGAFFPASRAPFVLKIVIYCNPLTYGFTAIQSCLQSQNLSSSVLTYSSAIAIEILFALVTTLIAIQVVSSRKKG